MNPLDQLKDIHLPSEVSWWPLAIGWWALLVLVLLGCFLLWRIWKKKQQYKQQHSVMSEAFDTLAADSTLDDREWLGELSALLKRIVISLHGRDAGAGLVGQDWLYFLDKQGNTDQFSKGVGQVLESAPYQESVQYDRSELLALVKQWLKTQLKKGGSNA